MIIFLYSSHPDPHSSNLHPQPPWQWLTLGSPRSQSRPILLAYQGFYLRTVIVIFFLWWSILLLLFAGSLKSSIICFLKPLLAWRKFFSAQGQNIAPKKWLFTWTEKLEEKVISCTGSRHLHIDVAGTGGLDVSPIQFCRGDRGAVHILVRVPNPDGDPV